MKTSGIFLIMILSSCALVPEDNRVFFFGDNQSVVLQSNGVSLSTELTFEVDLIFLSGTSKNVTLAYYEQNDFSFSSPGNYTLLDLSEVERSAPLQAATMILIDQSGTYDSADASNFRSKLIHQFISELKPPTAFLLGGFSKGGLLSSTPLELGATGFSANVDTSRDYLFGLSARTGGQSVLYDAALLSIEELKKMPGPRDLVLLAHQNDQSSTATLDDVIASASLNGVRIHIAFLGKVEDASPMAKLSQQTGGLFSRCAKMEEMITFFNHLNSLFNEPKFVYRLRAKFTPPVGTLVSGVDTYHQLEVHDAINDSDFSPIKFHIKTP